MAWPQWITGFVEMHHLPVMRHEVMNGLVRGRTAVPRIPAKDGSCAGDILNMASQTGHFRETSRYPLACGRPYFPSRILCAKLRTCVPSASMRRCRDASTSKPM